MITFLSSNVPPKLATPQPTSRTTLTFFPHSRTGNVYGKTRTVKLKEKWRDNSVVLLCIYLLYVVDVVNHTVFELSSTSREDKERSGFTNPVLVFLVVYKLGVRRIIIPYLHKHKSLEKQNKNRGQCSNQEAEQEHRY